MDLAYELHDLVLTLDKQAETLLQPLGISYRRYVALVIVDEHPGVTGRDLSRALLVTEAAASGIVKRLLADGLIVDTSAAGSGHVRRLEATDDGRALRVRSSKALGTTLDDTVRELGIEPTAFAHTIRSIHDAVLAPPVSDKKVANS
ncbi:MarR family winged helix-turn-helix transcriptional regulator [Spelaeicoccus albus]|uniref:DNA-binding MarR family transcriptional regulator n=1 Tax=Spelaeicoccus albus TaxID=1280376 RepID=A0A7Z0D394_9MICO|nr:MarR family transcriptional regulator [Spelaeicoccus albus]NYI68050.1 DNA-binding MarR family transcriptional regulator [Spelaeicoccus albus]